MELIGCSHETPSIPPTPEVEKPKYCEDEMGVNNGNMSPTQISVSSQLDAGFSKNHLKIDDYSAWQPLTNSLTEFVQFNFMGPRNLTGSCSIKLNELD